MRKQVTGVQASDWAPWQHDGSRDWRRSGMDKADMHRRQATRLAPRRNCHHNRRRREKAEGLVKGLPQQRIRRRWSGQNVTTNAATPSAVRRIWRRKLASCC